MFFVILKTNMHVSPRVFFSQKIWEKKMSFFNEGLYIYKKQSLKWYVVWELHEGQ